MQAECGVQATCLQMIDKDMLKTLKVNMQAVSHKMRVWHSMHAIGVENISLCGSICRLGLLLLWLVHMFQTPASCILLLNPSACSV